MPVGNTYEYELEPTEAVLAFSVGFSGVVEVVVGVLLLVLESLVED